MGVEDRAVQDLSMNCRFSMNCKFCCSLVLVVLMVAWGKISCTLCTDIIVVMLSGACSADGSLGKFIVHCVLIAFWG